MKKLRTFGWAIFAFFFFKGIVWLAFIYLAVLCSMGLGSW